jgi:hypothetical protein
MAATVGDSHGLARKGNPLLAEGVIPLHHANDARPPFIVHSSLDDLVLTPVQFRIYAHCVRRGGIGGFYFESVPNAARHCRVRPDTFRRGFKKLLKLLLLTLHEKRPGRVRVYQVNGPCGQTIQPHPKQDPRPVSVGVSNHGAEHPKPAEGSAGLNQGDTPPKAGGGTGTLNQGDTPPEAGGGTGTLNQGGTPPEVGETKVIPLRPSLEGDPRKGNDKPNRFEKAGPKEKQSRALADILPQAVKGASSLVMGWQGKNLREKLLARLGGFGPRFNFFRGASH